MQPLLVGQRRPIVPLGTRIPHPIQIHLLVTRRRHLDFRSTSKISFFRTTRFPRSRRAIWTSNSRNQTIADCTGYHLGGFEQESTGVDRVCGESFCSQGGGRKVKEEERAVALFKGRLGGSCAMNETGMTTRPLLTQCIIINILLEVLQCKHESNDVV